MTNERAILGASLSPVGRLRNFFSSIFGRGKDHDAIDRGADQPWHDGASLAPADAQMGRSEIKVEAGCGDALEMKKMKSANFELGAVDELTQRVADGSTNGADRCAPPDYGARLIDAMSDAGRARGPWQQTSSPPGGQELLFDRATADLARSTPVHWGKRKPMHMLQSKDEGVKDYASWLSHKRFKGSCDDESESGNTHFSTPNKLSSTPNKLSNTPNKLSNMPNKLSNTPNKLSSTPGYASVAARALNTAKRLNVIASLTDREQQRYGSPRGGPYASAPLLGDNNSGMERSESMPIRSRKRPLSRIDLPPSTSLLETAATLTQTRRKVVAKATPLEPSIPLHPTPSQTPPVPEPSQSDGAAKHPVPPIPEPDARHPDQPSASAGATVPSDAKATERLLAKFMTFSESLKPAASAPEAPVHTFSFKPSPRKDVVSLDGDEVAFRRAAPPKGLSANDMPLGAPKAEEGAAAAKSGEISAVAVKSDEISAVAVKSDEISAVAVKSDEISATAVKSDEISAAAVKSNEISTATAKSDETVPAEADHFESARPLLTESEEAKSSGGSAGKDVERAAEDWSAPSSSLPVVVAQSSPVDDDKEQRPAVGASNAAGRSVTAPEVMPTDIESNDRPSASSELAPPRDLSNDAGGDHLERATSPPLEEEGTTSKRGSRPFSTSVGSFSSALASSEEEQPRSSPSVASPVFGGDKGRVAPKFGFGASSSSIGDAFKKTVAPTRPLWTAPSSDATSPEQKLPAFKKASPSSSPFGGSDAANASLARPAFSSAAWPSAAAPAGGSVLEHGFGASAEDAQKGLAPAKAPSPMFGSNDESKPLKIGGTMLFGGAGRAGETSTPFGSHANGSTVSMATAAPSLFGPSGSGAAAVKSGPFDSSSTVKSSPFGSSSSTVKSSLFGSTTSVNSGPFDDTTSVKSGPFGSATSANSGPFGSATTVKSGLFDSSSTTVKSGLFDRSSSTVKSGLFDRSSSTVKSGPFGSTTSVKSGPFGSTTSVKHGPFGSATSASSSPFGSATSASSSPFDSSAPVNNSSPFDGSAHVKRNRLFDSSVPVKSSPFDSSAPFPLAAGNPVPQVNPFGMYSRRDTPADGAAPQAALFMAANNGPSQVAAPMEFGRSNNNLSIPHFSGGFGAAPPTSSDAGPSWFSALPSTEFGAANSSFAAPGGSPFAAAAHSPFGAAVAGQSAPSLSFGGSASFSSANPTTTTTSLKDIQFKLLGSDTNSSSGFNSGPRTRNLRRMPPR